MHFSRMMIALTTMACASDAIAQTSTCMDMGGGMTHCDTMGSNGSTSSTNCQAMGGSMATCNTMGMNPPQRSYPTPDMSRPQTNGSTLDFIGSLVARSQERSFQKKLGAMISSGDCEGAATFAFSKGRSDASEWVSRACHPKAAVEMPDGYTEADIAAMVAKENSSKSTLAASARSLPISPAPMALVSAKPASSDPSRPTMEVTAESYNRFKVEYSAWKRAGGKANKRIVEPTLDGSQLDTEYNVKYLGHSFSLVGPKNLSIEELRTRFDEQWNDSPWIKYVTSDNGSVYFYNIKTEKYYGDHVEVWVKGNHLKDRTIKMRESNILYEIQCVEDKMRRLQTTYYGADGGVLSSEDQPESFYRVIPESVSSALFNEMCKAKP